MKEKKSSFTGEKTGWHHIDQVIQVIISNAIKQSH